jgi:hypothetical protein
MDPDELEGLIRELRGQLLEHGFAWALEQAEAAQLRDATTRDLALALIDAVESVTTTLGRIELEATHGLKVEQILFEDDQDAAYSTSLERRVSGTQRRELITELAALGPVFEELRVRVRGQ